MSSNLSNLLPLSSKRSVSPTKGEEDSLSFATFKSSSSVNLVCVHVEREKMYTCVCIFRVRVCVLSVCVHVFVHSLCVCLVCMLCVCALAQLKQWQ